MANLKRRGSPISGKRKAKAVRGEVLLDDRTQRRLSRIRWRRIGAVLAITGVFAGLVALYFSPTLRVHEIEVGGATTISAADIEALAGLDGASLLTANLSAAELSGLNVQVGPEPTLLSERLSVGFVGERLEG